MKPPPIKNKDYYDRIGAKTQALNEVMIHIVN